MRHRKGNAFFWGTFVIMVLIFMGIILVQVNKKLYSFDHKIGYWSLRVMNTIEEGEKVNYYIDKSAELALRKTLHELALLAGKPSNDCGDYDSYKLWNFNRDNCFPTDEDILTNIESDFVTYFETGLANYKEDFPVIDYRYSVVQEEDNLKIIARARESLRLEISEEDTYNFAAASFYESGESEDLVWDGGPIGEGKCGDLVDYAAKFIGCPYDLDVVAFSTPSTCRNVGLTCATFVGSVISSTLGLGAYPYGHGRQKCDASNVQKIGKDPNRLHPGDLFSTEYRKIDGSYTAWGHTGMYVGKGHVSQPDGPWCYRRFTPDENGEYVFIHSYGSQNLGKPGVCYDTYNHLFTSTTFILTSFCRLNQCI